MNGENEKYAKAIAKIVLLTQKGQLTWQKEFSANALIDVRQTRYVTNLKGERLRLTKLDRNSTNIFLASAVSSFSYRNSTALLEAIEESGSVKYPFPPLKVIDELLKVVEEKGTAIDQFVGRLLEED